MKKKNVNQNETWIISAKVYEEIRRTIGCRKPEHGGILGSRDGKHIDYYYFDKTATRTGVSYTMDTDALNKVIHRWNDDGIQLVGIIHSHPQGVTRPSAGDMETAKHIIETIDVQGRFFTPIVQVSPKLNGEIKIYPYSFVQTVEMKGQSMIIEPPKADQAHQQRAKQHADKAPNRFKRIEGIFPDNLMADKTVICIGCGGSRQFIESLARCGVGNFILWDGDVVEDTNIATQGTYISEIGKPKCEVIRDRIFDINPMANVTCINKFLDEDTTDEEFAVICGIEDMRYEDVIITGCTDSFFAQDRCAQLSLKYGVPYLAAQVFAKGVGHEVIFWYPGVTDSCPRCMLATRYRKVLADPEAAKGSSANTAVCVTEYLNVIKTRMALNILCYKEQSTPFFHELDRYADRNYLMTKCSDTLKAPAFEGIDELERRESDLTLPYVTVAIGQTPEPDCPLCHGTGKIGYYKYNITDTRKVS